MKKLVFLAVFLPLLVHGQKVNEDKSGYVEVVEIELNKSDLNELLLGAITEVYNSAKDVIQLSGANKIIAKGNFSFNLEVPAAASLLVPNGFNYIINTSLNLGVKDNKYRIELIPKSVEYADLQVQIQMQKIGAENPGNELFLPYKSDNVLNKEEYAIVFRNNIKRTYLKMNYSEEKAQKKAEKMAKKSVNGEGYNYYLKNKANWDSIIYSMFDGIKNYVSNSRDQDDDW